MRIKFLQLSNNFLQSLLAVFVGIINIFTKTRRHQILNKLGPILLSIFGCTHQTRKFSSTALKGVVKVVDLSHEDCVLRPCD